VSRYIKTKKTDTPKQEIQNDIRGQKFNHWYVLPVDPTVVIQRSGKRKVYFWCKCDCEGTEPRLLTSNRLKRGDSKSCGCTRSTPEMRLKQGIIRRQDPERVTLNSLYSECSYGATDRGLIFDVPLVVFAKIVKEPCTYCGRPPSREYLTKYRDGSSYSMYVSGIDRINNELGYISGNIVPCCSKCNFMKLDLTLDEFISRCFSIARIHGS
jgi:hypothetical protein